MKNQQLYASILCGVVDSLLTPLGIDPSRDMHTIKSRASAEAGFLDKTLPTLDALLLEALEKGFLPVSSGWKCRKGTNTPQFLAGLWDRVFAPNGCIYSDPCPVAILAIRQISVFYKKIFEVCEQQYIDEAVKRFIDEDRELSRVQIPSYMDDLRRVWDYLFRDDIRYAMHLFDSDRLPYGHGPGAVSERLDSVARWGFQKVAPRVLDFFGPEIFRATWHDLQNRYPVEEEIFARLVAVPKTATKPRLISIEPSYNQYVQQGLSRVLFKRLSKYRICSISDQSLNKKLARHASIPIGMDESGRYKPHSRQVDISTVDLSSASDRIHNGLLMALTASEPLFQEFLQVSRSRAVQIGDQVLNLNKFASMGSALTFPIETMFFTTLVVYAGLLTDDTPLTRYNVRKFLRHPGVRVYGDDIICPTDWIPTLYRLFDETGLAVNQSKSFHGFGFRESCGGDYWRGVNVTPVYVRKHAPRTKHDAEQVIGWVSLHNQLLSRYSFEYSNPLLKQIRSLCDRAVKVPRITAEFADSGSPTTSFLSFLDAAGKSPYGFIAPEPTRQRWNADLQKWEQRVLRLRAVRRKADAPDHSVLFKALCAPEERKDHLFTHGRPVTAKLNYGWSGQLS